MRNILILPLLFFTFIGGTISCNDFLDKQPTDAFTDENYWTSEANLRSFAWKFYSDFIAYGSMKTKTAEFYFQDATSDACINISDDLANADFLNYQTSSPTTNKDWKSYYTSVRRANLMLERIPQMSNLDSDARNHWSGVARFFRAYSYFKLIQRFGAVPYSEQYVASNDFNNIYLKRTEHIPAMDKVKADLEEAIKLMRVKDETNTINKYVGLALLSRVCLYEGTFRKYHNQGDGTTYLERAKSAAAEVMGNSAFKVGADFQAMYNSLDLKTSSEMILYLEYVKNIYTQPIQNYTNTSTEINGMTKWAIESYACTDGLPISQSTIYQGDDSYDNSLLHRDKRLHAALRPEGLGYRGKPLPGDLKSATGYVVGMYNNPAVPKSDLITDGGGYIDAPIFGLSEVLLNYAEACAELGTMTQADMDKSINLLRPRAGLPLLTVDGQNVKVGNVVVNDPKRTAALEQITGVVSPLIWEIRRERRAELMTWTHIRYYDIMRWKKGEYLDTEKNVDVALGAKVGEDKGSTTTNADGYIVSYPGFQRQFNPAKHYLNAIPINDILLFSNEGLELDQNPNWNK